MGMEMVIELLVAHLNRHRAHLADATISLIDQLRETDAQPDEAEKTVLYEAERKLRRDLGDEEYFRRS